MSWQATIGMASAVSSFGPERRIERMREQEEAWRRNEEELKVFACVRF